MNDERIPSGTPLRPRDLDAPRGEVGVKAPHPGNRAPDLKPTATATQVAESTKTAMAMVRNSISERVDRLQRALEVINDTAGQDLDRIHKELDAYMVSAEALARECDGIDHLLEDIRSKRAKLVQAKATS